MLCWFLPYNNIHQPHVSLYPLSLALPTTSHPSRSSQSGGLSSLCYRATSYYFTHRVTYMGEGNGTPLQYSCLGNPTDRGAWRATVHRVTQSRTRLSNWTSVHESVPHSQMSQPSPSHCVPKPTLCVCVSAPTLQIGSSVPVSYTGWIQAPTVDHRKAYSPPSDKP